MLTKLKLKSGVNKENTQYNSEGGWYNSDKIRFRQGAPEVIGGWQQISSNTFLGICRLLWGWVTLGGARLLAVGTSAKFYIERGGEYFDITPISDETTGSATFAATTGSSTLTVTDIAHGANAGDYVIFASAASLGGVITATVLNTSHQIVSVINVDSYTITVGVAANASDTGDGGASTVASYQISVGAPIEVPAVGWGAGPWSLGTWGVGVAGTTALRLWSAYNFGEDLIFGPRGGGVYVWEANSGVSTPGVALSSLMGASDTPTKQNIVMVSDVSRFVLAFGANELGGAAQDPMLIRWSDQESYLDWTPSPLNQAGGLRLSHGSEIIAAVQTRQEIVVFTDMSVYGLQYLGPPAVWGATLLADGTSCISPNAAVVASGVTYWMGIDKFYKYDGNVTTLRCDLKEYVYSDINLQQQFQCFGGVNEGFNEVWWFYCSSGSTVIDKYVIYNYLEDIWYYGTMGRTAWLDAGIRNAPVAATYSQNLVDHEVGVDDNQLADTQPIYAYIESAEWDIEDGDNFVFIRRVLPDVTFRGSTAGTTPKMTLTLKPLRNSGSGFNTPLSVGGDAAADVNRIATVPIEEFTGQVFIRVRGRQFVLRLESDQIGTTWQAGGTRVDYKLDGKRG
jgi:hypothetical protein